ncbi:MAG TPA: flavodoxin domain-containing protein [Miltoncostaeaceae bacterium]|nr:flavodoxin domain-containing protein [Miltoncostaeaceae bacterium]
MRAVVVYESMFGNTRAVAERIAAGLRTAAEAEAIPVIRADAAALAGADLVVVGGPTHVHGMTRASTRQAAAEQAAAPDAEVHLDADAAGPGLREWFAGGPLPAGAAAAAFDTRVNMSPLLTGRAARGIAHRLRDAGATLAAAPESFLVDRHNRLEDGEAERAEGWGRSLAAALSAGRT